MLIPAKNHSMNPGSPLRVALIGLGYASDFHIPAVVANPRLRLVAVSDLDSVRLSAAARRWSVDAVADSRQLVARSDVDVVGILTPPTSHLEIALLALAAGKHLVIEKPITASLDEADRLIAAASASRSKVVVAYVLRFVRQVRMIRDLLTQGELGDVEILRVLASTPEMLSPTAPAHRRDRQQGGGSVIELGVHHYDLWSHLLGASIESVHAMSRSERFHDQSTVVTARMACGSLATTCVSLCGADQYQVEVIGSKARATASLLRYDGLEVVAAGSRGGVGAVKMAALARAVRDLPYAIRSSRHGGTFRASFYGLWDSLADAIVHDFQPEPGLRAGRSSLAAAIASSRASLSGNTVRLSDVESGR